MLILRLFNVHREERNTLLTRQLMLSSCKLLARQFDWISYHYIEEKVSKYEIFFKMAALIMSKLWKSMSTMKQMVLQPSNHVNTQILLGNECICHWLMPRRRQNVLLKAPCRPLPDVPTSFTSYFVSILFPLGFVE